MAQRGVAVISDTFGGFQSGGYVRLYINYQGFQAASEAGTFTVDIPDSLVGAVTLKGFIKTELVNWYSNNTSQDYDAWNNLLDSFILIGGIV